MQLMSTRRCLQTTRAADNRQPWLVDLLLMRHVKVLLQVCETKSLTHHYGKINL